MFFKQGRKLKIFGSADSYFTQKEKIKLKSPENELEYLNASYREGKSAKERNNNYK